MILHDISSADNESTQLTINIHLIHGAERPPQQERSCWERCWTLLSSKHGRTITKIIMGLLCFLAGGLIIYFTCKEKTILDNCNNTPLFLTGLGILMVGGAIFVSEGLKACCEYIHSEG